MSDLHIPTPKDVIQFKATVAQVRTMADGGIRLVLDLPETAIDTAADMMKAKQAGAVLECAVIPVTQSHTNGKTETDKRPARNPIEVD
jgi:hypothetical protein